MQLLNKIFPRAPARQFRQADFWEGRKKPFAIAMVASSVVLQLLFLINYCYIFGSLFRVSHREHNLNTLLVDFDGALIGEALSTAASSLAADTFLGVQHGTTEQYASSAAVYNAVRDGKFWAAIYTHAGATERLAAALQGGDAATSYDTSDVISYVFNEARYAAASDGYIKSSLEELVQVSRIYYNHINGTGVLQTMNQTDAAALQVFLTPWASNAVNIQPTIQGDRVLLNTVVMVLPIIMQFFCLMAINGISAHFGLYSNLSITSNVIARNSLALVFTFISSLCLSGAIWAFKESWQVTGGEFVCLWMILWLYMHINFLVMDVATAFIAIKFLPFFVITWVVVNVTSTIFPFELSPGFYRIGYAWPAHETWQVMMQIFSGGAMNRLYQGLPILFAYEILLLPVSTAAMHHRCIAATHAEDEEREEEEHVRALEKLHQEHEGQTEAQDSAHKDQDVEKDQNALTKVLTLAPSYSRPGTDDSTGTLLATGIGDEKRTGEPVVRALQSKSSNASLGRAASLNRAASLKRRPSALSRSGSAASRREYWPAAGVPFVGQYAQPPMPQPAVQQVVSEEEAGNKSAEDKDSEKVLRDEHVGV